ncbi:MAG TPA: pentapeptide repeat-containing protein [Ktedonobacterales bacterium]
MPLERQRDLALIYKSRALQHQIPYQGVHIEGLPELLWIAHIHKWELKLPASLVSRLTGRSSDKPQRATGDTPPKAQIDLRGAVLRDVDASSLNFTGALLQQATFERCILKGVVFAQADLRGARFLDSPLDQTVFLNEHERRALLGRVPGGDISRYIDASRSLTRTPPLSDRIPIATRNELLWLTEVERVDIRFLDLRKTDIFEDDILGLALSPRAMRPDHGKEVLCAIRENRRRHWPPLKNVSIASWQEWYWLKTTRKAILIDGESDHPRFDMRSAQLYQGAFQGADLQAVNLSHGRLAEAHLEYADISDAKLDRANLEHTLLNHARMRMTTLRRTRLDHACMDGANLTRANLRKAHLPYASLLGACVSVANLQHADCLCANFKSADLRGAQVNASTSLIDIAVDSATLWGDLVWHGTPLLEIDWTGIKRLGDDMQLSLLPKGTKQTTRDTTYREVTRAYHQIYLKLKDQGFYAVASRLRLREKELERKQLWEHKMILAWFRSFVSFLLIGYGEKPGQLFYVTALVVEIFAGLYLLVDHLALPPTQQIVMTTSQAALLSLSGLKGPPNFPNEILRLHFYGSLLRGLGILETGIGSVIVLAFTILWTEQLMGNELRHIQAALLPKRPPGKP